MALIRTALLSGLVYFLYAIAFPDYTGDAYHFVAISFIAGGAVGVFFLHKILDLGEGMAKILIELAFVGVVIVGLGYTMPQRSGKSPLEQLAAGARPNQDAARKGMERLGLDPHAGLGRKFVGLFPR